MYQIVVVSAHAPKSGGGKYRRPVHVRVFNPNMQRTAYAAKGYGRSVEKVAEWRNVDSRYNGPKSAFGKAIREANTLIDSLSN